MLTSLLFAGILFGAEEPIYKPNPQQQQNPDVAFIAQKPACVLSGNKLVLARAWPLGSWEDCAYSILGLTIQLENRRVQVEKQLQELTAKQAKK